MMRTAQIAPLVERVPPRKYGGTERIVAALAAAGRLHEIERRACRAATSGCMTKCSPRADRATRTSRAGRGRRRTNARPS